MTTYPTVTFQNKLNVPFVVYDAFQSDPNAPSSPSTFFGTLTQLATVQPNSSAPVIPIHGPISTYLAYGADGTPIAREFTLGSAPVTLTVDDTDTMRINETEKFVNAITADPKGSLATTFQPLLQSDHAASKVNAFFQSSDYKDCTFVTYLMVIAAGARTSGHSVQDASYSLSKLCNSLGGTWPPGFPDVKVTNFTCSAENDTLVIGGDVDTSSLTFVPEGNSFIRSILPSTVRATFQFHYGLDLGMFGTRISFSLPQITLVSGVHLNNPTISLDISPLFRFAVFTAKATIPFTLFGSPEFDANVSMVIDNVEAEIAVDVDGKGHTLLTPPIMKGVHFDEFGVGMGLFFEPPAYALGVEGKFHIGDGSNNIVELDDDTFVVVCSLEGDVPNPLYVSFYVAKATLGDVITIFTNSSIDLGIPITVSDLSFQWAENPMEPIALPDGSLSQMGYGFSGSLDVFGLSFYGDVEINASGLKGNVTMDPLSLGPLSLTGNGQGVTIKVDANGNPIRNNQIVKSKAAQDAIAHAGVQTLVKPGGPSLLIDTGGSPYLSLGAAVSLFDLVNESINVTVDSNGVSFELDYGAVLQGTMKCALAGYDNFTGEFSYGIDTSIPLPSIAGFSMGSIPLEAMVDAMLTIGISDSGVSMSLGGGFDFEGITMQIGPFGVDVPIGSVSDLGKSLIQWVLDHAADLFKDFLGDAGKWAGMVLQGVIQGVDSVANGLKTAFNKASAEVASIMASVGFDITDTAHQIGQAFSAGAQEVGAALQVGYNATADVAADVLRNVGYGATDVASALSSVFGEAPDAVNDIMQGVGYSVDEIQDAFENLGGDFASWAESAWGELEHIANPSNW